MDFACKICNKKYKSYQSLWNHNHKFHATTKNTLSTLGIHSDYIKPSKMSTSSIQLEYTKAKLDENDDIKNNICKFCNKELYNRQSRWRHELKCQITWITESKSDGLNIDYNRLSSIMITDLMKKYVLEYVYCKKCKSTNTIISKDSQIRKYLSICQNCGDQYYH